MYTCEHEGCLDLPFAQSFLGRDGELHDLCLTHAIEDGYCISCRVQSEIPLEDGLCPMCAVIQWDLPSMPDVLKAVA